jgi:hypothetical protein
VWGGPPPPPAAPQNQVPLDLGAPEIKVTVFETDILGDLGRSIQHKRRRLRLIEDLQVIRQHLDLAGLEIGIRHPLRPAADPPMDREDEFAPDPPGLIVTCSVDIRVEYDLNEPLPVAKVDKDDASVIASPVGPAHQHHFLPGMQCIDIAAVMGSFSYGQKVGQDRYLSIFMIVSSMLSRRISSWVLACMFRRMALFSWISRSPRISA